MSESELPYITHCGFCEQGLVRFQRCNACQAVVATCDECELTWTDIAAVFEDPSIASSGAFPACPRCGLAEAEWSALNRAEVESEDLSDLLAGDSP